ncbi:MAG: peptide chain release factor N(5)-glutamine methyltransferase [Bacteroidales bacterium]
MHFDPPTYRNIRNAFLSELKGIMDEPEIRSVFRMVTEKYAGHAGPDLTFRLDENAGPDILCRYRDALDQLKRSCPVQYLLKEARFYGLVFRVAEGVLIPRPETEELVRWVVEDHRGCGPLRIMDIGTGSGCIAVSLSLHLPGADVDALDISARAIEIASYNAWKYHAGVRFFKADILNHENLDFLTDYDILVSNPPYVRACEKKWMRQNVLRYEPEEALFVKDDAPLVFYDAVLGFAEKHLKPGGHIYAEINESLAGDVMEKGRQKGYAEVVLKQDMHGRDRMLRFS